MKEYKEYIDLPLDYVEDLLLYKAGLDILVAYLRSHRDRVSECDWRGMLKVIEEMVYG